MATEVEVYRQRKQEQREKSALVDAPVTPQTPASVDQYVVRKEENRKQNAAAAALIVENSGNPDQNAADDQLAREYQTKVNPDVTPPPSFVATNRDRLSAEVKRATTTTMLSTSPMLTRWLDNTANARVAADDVSVLANIEAGLGHLRDALKRGIVDRSVQVGSQMVADTSVWLADERGLSFEDRFKDARGEHYGYGFFGKPLEPGGTVNPDGSVSLPQIQSMGDDPVTAFFKATTGTAADLVTGMLGGTREGDLQRAAQFQQMAAQAAANAASTPISPTAQRALSAFQSDEPLSLGEAAQRALNLAVNDPGALAAMVVEVGVESTGAMIPAAVATAATRNPAIGAAVMGGTSYSVERNLAPVEFFASKGYDLTKPEDVQRMLSNPQLMAEAAQKGHTRGLIVGALDWLSGGVAGRVLAKNPVADAALQSMVQAALGGGGEGLAQYATEGQVNFGDVFVEALAEFSTAPIEVASIGARKFGEQQQAAARAETAAPVVDALSQAAQESKLRTRSPEAFGDYIANATRGGEMETMYFPSQEFIGYFQSQGVSLETVAEILPGVDLEQMRRAAVTGEDISMPTATYMERVAGSDMDAFALENSKFSPQDMTRAQAAAFREDERVREAQIAGEQEAARITREAEASATEALQADIAEQLVAAGRPRQAAQQEAQLYPAFYTALASRMGVTVEELMQVYRPPTVRGPEVSPLQAKRVDAVTRDLAGMRARIAARAAGGVQAKGAEADTAANKYLDAVEQAVVDAGLDPATATDDQVREILGKTYSQAVVPQLAGQRNLPSSQSLNVPAPPTKAEMDENVRTESVPLSDVVGTQGRMEWGKFEAGEHPGALIEGYEDKPVVARKESGEYLVYDGHHRIVLALERGDTAMDMYVIDVKSYDPANAGRKPAASVADMTDDDLLAALGVYQQTERGRISIPANGIASGQAVIDLFQKSDLSTFLHESSHFFLSVLQDAGAQQNAPQAVRDLYAQATGWWRDNAEAVAADAGNGVSAADVAAYLDNGTTGDVAKDAAVDTGMQEQWARAFETYLLEGKAPTAELRGAFEQFRAWLMEVYRKVKGDLNVRVTDDIRQVFDRLLATDAEISKANVDNNGAMLAKTAAELGVSEADYQKLAALHQEAQDQAAARAIADAMEPIRRMREAAYKERHAVIRGEVEAEVNARPVYRAIEWLGNKRWLGAEEQPSIPNGMRLNKEQLVERYGPGVLRTLPRGSFRVYTPEGMDIDEAAGWFGFNSGDELVRAMEQAPRREDVITKETDNRTMAELNREAGTVDAAFAATEAFHTDKRGDYIAAELRTLNIGLGGAAAKTSTASYARQVAKRTIGGMKARDAVASNRYLSAERRAAEQAQAAFAAGDRAKAADFKRQQLFNHMLFTESRRVADEVVKTERLAKRLSSAGTRKNLANDYLGAIDDVLEQYDFRKQGPGKEANRARMLAYIEKMKAAGRENEIAIPQHIIDNARAEPYMTLTVDRLRGVHDTLKNIENMARRAQKLIDAKSERDMDQVVADFGDAFAQNVKARPPARVETKGERLRRGGRQFLDIVLNADTLLREIDGFKDVDGPAYTNLKRGIDEATARLQVRRQQAAEAFLIFVIS